MSSPKRIAHILPWSGVGGTEHATLRIAKAVEGLDFTSVFYCLDTAPAVREFFAATGFETVPYREVQPSYRHPRNFWRASRELARDFRNRRIDLVHCADITAAHFTSFAGKLAGCRVLSHVRNRRDHFSLRDRTFLWPVDRFVFVSADTWRRFGHRVSKRRGVVLYDGLDLPSEIDPCAAADVRAELGLPAGTRLIGMVARVSLQKDYETLIRAAVPVVAAHPDVRFIILGDHSEVPEHRAHFSKVQQWLAAHGIEPYFLFTGFRTDVPRFLQAFDIFVLSTHWEGLPLVIIEAMAYGRPVVATAVDGIPEIVIDGQTGLLVPHKDAAKLAAHLTRLLSDPAWSATLAAAGRDSVRTRFSREQFAGNLRRLYTDLLKT